MQALCPPHRSSVGPEGLWGHSFEWLSNPTQPSHLHTIVSLMYRTLSPELFNQYHQENRNRPATLCANSHFSILSWGLFSLIHQVLQCRAIEVILNGTHYTQREYCLTAGLNLRDPLSVFLSVSVCLSLPASLQRRIKNVAHERY